MSRAATLAAGLLAVFAGVLVGTSACHCPEVEPVPTGTFAIVDTSIRPELIDGVVEIGEDEVVVEFVDADGNAWAVYYTIESHSP